MIRSIFLFLFILVGFQCYAQVDSIRNYIFGHSLLVHEPQDTSYPSNETTVPHWVHAFAVANNNSYNVSGQFGFLPQHANLPPIAQWGFDQVPSAWESDTELFSEADFNTVILTAANFVQDQPAHIPYHNEVTLSPSTATQQIVDWVTDQEEGIQVYIYENWPDMAGFIAGELFPPSSSELVNYHNYTTGAFHDWWIEYQDSVVANRPTDNVKMIPVGPIMASLLSSTLINIPIDELYEDNAPHGRPSIYFLAGMITYMAMYEEKPSSSFTVPNTVHSLIGDNYQSIVDEAWDYLQAFNFDDGSSRVFANANMTTAAADVEVALDGITLYPNPTTGIFQIEGETSAYDIDILDVMGNVYQTIDNSNRVSINLSDLPNNLYFVRMRHKQNGGIHVELILKQ